MIKSQSLHHGGAKSLRKTLLLLTLGILFVPATVVFASSANVTRVNILMSDSEGHALSNVQIALDLNIYESIASDQMELRGAYSDECTTDAQGKCNILIGEMHGYLLRGHLDLGKYGSRNLEWRGGVLNVPIQIKQQTASDFNQAPIYTSILFILIALAMIIQRKRTFMLALLIILIPSSFAFASALAAPVNHCLDAADPLCLTMFEGIGKLIAEWIKTFAVSLSQVIAIFAWVSAKLVLAAYDLIVNGSWLDIFREDLIGNIATLMPQVLRDIALGPTGLMYIALSLSGIIMIIPLVSAGADRLVRPERVIIWGILLTALFISGSAGYDLVGMIEDLRVSVIRQMMGSDDTTTAVENLLLTPMKATDSEKDLDIANLTELPAQFVTAYFPAIEREEVTVRLAESSVVFSGILNTDVETIASDVARTNGAMQALLYSLIELAAAAVILGFALAFIFLGIAALILILFLMAALPLGFFEFGNIILTKIVERYVQIVTLSMVLALFMRVSAGLMAALPKAESTSAIVEWLLLIGALFIALQMIFGMAYKALTDSFSSFSNSVRLATGMPLPPQGQGVMSTLGRVATGAALGAVFGGGGAGALAGGAGELIGAPLMASWKDRNEAAPQKEEPRGNVFLENGFGTSPIDSNNARVSTPASAFIEQAQPVIPSRSIIQSNLKEIAPMKTVSDETSRAVSASKSLFPDER